MGGCASAGDGRKNEIMAFTGRMIGCSLKGRAKGDVAPPSLGEDDDEEGLYGNQLGDRISASVETTRTDTWCVDLCSIWLPTVVTHNPLAPPPCLPRIQWALYRRKRYVIFGLESLHRIVHRLGVVEDFLQITDDLGHPGSLWLEGIDGFGEVRKEASGNFGFGQFLADASR